MNNIPKWLDGIDLDFAVKRHLLQPCISSEDYIANKRLAIGKGISNKVRIYLDQNYWIYCTAAKHGRSKDPTHLDIWNILRNAVSSGKVVCPASASVLTETLKNRDPEVRIQIAEVVDELSQQVSLRRSDCLTRYEILAWLNAARAEYPLSLTVWTCPYESLCGDIRSETKAMASEANAKACFDVLSNMRLSDLVRACKENLVPSDKDLAERENRLLPRNNNAAQVFEIEIRRSLYNNWDILYSIAAESTRLHLPRTAYEKQTRLLIRQIYDAFLQGKISDELPGIGILAGFRAAKRVKQFNKPFNKGDVHDWDHARYALPYCDIFLTEKNMGTVLTVPDFKLEYDKLYNCKVLWDKDNVLAELQKMFPG